MGPICSTGGWQEFAITYLSTSEGLEERSTILKGSDKEMEILITRFGHYILYAWIEMPTGPHKYVQLLCVNWKEKGRSGSFFSVVVKGRSGSKACGPYSYWVAFFLPAFTFVLIRNPLQSDGRETQDLGLVCDGSAWYIGTTQCGQPQGGKSFLEHPWRTVVKGSPSAAKFPAAHLCFCFVWKEK